jgi:hypothetical protein
MNDASKCWRIMPFALGGGVTEWWVLGPDNKSVGRFGPTREEAFRTALEHNKKTYGIHAVFVHGFCGKNGAWKQE